MYIENIERKETRFPSSNSHVPSLYSFELAGQKFDIFNYDGIINYNKGLK